MRRSISRRRWLAQVALIACGMIRLRNALAAERLAKGIARVRGEVTVNGQPAEQGMQLKPGDRVATGRDAELVAVFGRDAFILRADTQVELAAGKNQRVVRALRVVTGAMLAVFAPGQSKEIRTDSASIGIRGTAVYVELERDRTYVCTCYGVARLVPVDAPRAAETVRTKHHDQPRYVYRQGMPTRIEKAPVINHTDAELILLESLVGRKVPFSATRY